MNPTKSLQRPHKITSQFLPRSLKVSPETTAFRNCRVKGFYLKKLLTYSQEDDNFHFLDFESVSQVFRNKKIHKTLHHAEVCSSLKPYVHSCLKTTKNLKTYALEFYGNEFGINSITIALRRLPAIIQSVDLKFYLNFPLKKEYIYKIARFHRRFPQLQSIQKKFLDHTDGNEGRYLQKELALYCRSAARLKEIKRMTYCISALESSGLQRAMRTGFLYRGITGLEFAFCQNQNLDDVGGFLDSNNEYLFLNFENMTPNEQAFYKRIKDEIKKKDKARNDDIDWSVKTLSDEKYEEKDLDHHDYEEVRIDPRFIALCRVTEEMRPFYRFELFPDLKELSLTFSNRGYSFGCFVIDGFRALTNLENLKIIVEKRSIGMTFLFIALLELPLLKKFSLSMNDLGPEEWSLLGHFLHVQKKIEEFYFAISWASPLRTDYLQKNTFLKLTLQYLKTNFSLKSLHLDFPLVALESLSQGLSHLKMMNQLHTFKLKACDDIFTSQKSASERAEGLCQFLKNQKGSLRIFHIDLPLALEDTLITDIAEAVSHLSQLRELSFRCNFDFSGSQAFDYYQKTLQLKISPELQKSLTLPEKWSPNLAKNLQKLANLEKLIFDIGLICTGKTDPSGWFMDVILILPHLEQLKTLQICAIFKDGLLRKEKKIFANILRCLPRLKDIVIELYDPDHAPFPEELNMNKLNEEINKKLARKIDYLFY